MVCQLFAFEKILRVAHVVSYFVRWLLSGIRSPLIFFLIFIFHFDMHWHRLTADIAASHFSITFACTTQRARNWRYLNLDFRFFSLKSSCNKVNCFLLDSFTLLFTEFSVLVAVVPVQVVECLFGCQIDSILGFINLTRSFSG